MVLLDGGGVNRCFVVDLRRSKARELEDDLSYIIAARGTTTTTTAQQYTTQTDRQALYSTRTELTTKHKTLTF